MIGWVNINRNLVGRESGSVLVEKVSLSWCGVLQTHPLQFHFGQFMTVGSLHRD